MPDSEPMKQVPAQEKEIRFGAIARPGEVNAHVTPDRAVLHDENVIGIPENHRPARVKIRPPAAP
jgi:hypothetical protein